MRACACAVALAAGVALAVGTAGAASERTALIRPAQGIGKLRLGMSRAEALRAMGTPRAVVRRPAGFGLQSVEYQYGYAEYTVRFVGRPGRLRADRVTTVLRKERTRKGIGPGSLERHLRRAYPGVRCERLHVVVVSGIRFIRTNGRNCTLVTAAGRRTIFRTSIYLPTRETLTVAKYLRGARVDEVIVEAES